MTESGKASGGFWLGIIVLGICAIAVVLVVVPMLPPPRLRAPINSCINNLRELDAAVHCWSLEQKKDPGDPVKLADVTPYLKNGFTCPSGGQYKVGPAISNYPSCTITNHVLPVSAMEAICGQPLANR